MQLSFVSLALVIVGLFMAGCNASPKVEINLENSRCNSITIEAPVIGDPSKTTTTDATLRPGP